MSLSGSFSSPSVHSKEEAILDEVWQELLKCSVCNERIAVVRMEKIIDGSFSGHLRVVCVACLPKVVVELATVRRVASRLKTKSEQVAPEQSVHVD